MTRIELNIEEVVEAFKKLEEDDQHKEVHAYFGMAMFFAQILDQQAINMICIKRSINREVITKEEVETLWTNYEYGSRTLGVLINEIKQLYQLSIETVTELKRILKLRNYLVHDYYRFNSHLFLTQEGMILMLKDFVKFRNDIDKLTKGLVVYFDKYRLQMNLTDELLEKMLSEMEEEGKSINPNEYNTIQK